MLRPLRIVLLAFAAAALAAACASSAPTPPASPADVTISANNLQFAPTSVQAPAGRAFTIDFNNQETAQHNVTIATDNSFGNILFRGEIVGQQAIRYNVPALQAGTYPFRCDVHPDMLGTLVAQ
jgi:plastocyanin